MDERNVRSTAAQLERRLGRRVLAANHHDTLPVIRVAVVVVVVHVRQLFPRNVDHVRQVVVAGRQHNRPRVANTPCLRANPVWSPAGFRGRMRCPGRDGEDIIPVTLDGKHLLMRRDLKAVDVDDPAIVAERFQTRRFVVRRDERQAAHFEQLRRGEKHHMDRKVEDGVDEHAPLDDHIVEASLFGGNGRGQPRGASSNDQNVTDRHRSSRDESSMIVGAVTGSRVRGFAGSRVRGFMGSWVRTGSRVHGTSLRETLVSKQLSAERSKRCVGSAALSIPTFSCAWSSWQPAVRPTWGRVRRPRGRCRSPICTMLSRSSTTIAGWKTGPVRKFASGVRHRTPIRATS